MDQRRIRRRQIQSELIRQRVELNLNLRFLQFPRFVIDVSLVDPKIARTAAVKSVPFGQPVFKRSRFGRKMD
jgi:hypothetical protein